jgi:hypothetical protein
VLLPKSYVTFVEDMVDNELDIFFLSPDSRIHGSYTLNVSKQQKYIEKITFFILKTHTCTLIALMHNTLISK